MSAAGSALLFAAGQATRLAGLREHWAKACVPVAGTSPLGDLLPRVLAAGFAPAWINLHHHGEQVRAAAHAAAPDADLRFLEEPALLGTGGTLLAVAERQGALPALCANAKVFGDFDLDALRDAPPGALLLHPASPLAEFGGLRYDRLGIVRGLAPRAASAERGAAVFTGLGRPHPAWQPILARARAARPGAPLCLIRDGMLPAIAEGVEHRALLHRGWWCEVSTPERVAAAAARLTRPAPADRAAAGSDRGAR
jgi:MurNAc alpha-1-phosphate uridylyltransferase